MAGMGILFFLAIGIMGTVLLMEYLRGVDLATMSLIAFFVSMLVLLTNIAIYAFVTVQAMRSKPGLTLLTEVARRAELLMRIAQPIFDVLWEVSYRFEWDPERRKERIIERLEELERQLPREVVEKERGFWQKVSSIFSRERSLQDKIRALTTRASPSLNPCSHLGHFQRVGKEAVCEKCGLRIKVWRE